MEKASLKNHLRTALKILITAVALYIVYRKTDLEETKRIFTEIDIIFLLPATAFFVLSKVLSSLRLNQYFKSIGLSVSENYNLRLYWVGMFYNLFLPGGIGGDGYKVYLLNKQYRIGVKPLIGATLIDRISGLMALLFLLLCLCLFVLPLPFLSGHDWIIYAGILLGYPVFYLFNKLVFPAFLSRIVITSLYSLGVQLLQVISAWFILKSLGISTEYVAYQILFLASSIVAVLPFTIGGVGARELTFVLGHDYLGVDQSVAVAFSLLFFLITALVSLSGAFLKTEAREKDHQAQ